MTDTQSVLLWWVSILALGTLTLPLTRILFKNFIDQGYIFSKVLGILLTSYIVWLLSSIQLLPFSSQAIGIVSVFILAVNILIYRKAPGIKKLSWGWIITEEIIFLLALCFWSFVKGSEPSIHGLEKFMDFGFMSSILRTKYFPPLDMWLTKSPDYVGHYINYYYYGHYIAAFLTKLTNISSALTYNIMIATLFAFTFSLSFSIGANLYYLLRRTLHPNQPSIRYYSHIFFCGILAAFLVSMGGNLHTIYTLTEGYPNDAPVPPWQLKWGFSFKTYWYPNATRFIPFTIHEFPIYSFVVSDLHGHVSDIPFVLFTLAILLSLLTDKDHEEETKKEQLSLNNFLSANNLMLNTKYLILSLTLAVMYMTNAWDGLIYLFLALVTVFTMYFKQTKHMRIAVKMTAAVALIFFSGFVLFASPFILNFIPFASQVGLLCSPSFLLNKQIGPLIFEPEKCQKSPLYMLLILWGFFYFNVVGYILLIIIPNLRKKLAPTHHAKSKFRNLITAKLQMLNELPRTDIFVILLIVLSTGLLIFPEIFYLKDIYPAHYRANTMFKLGYQAFMMLALCSGFILFRIRATRKALFYTLMFLVLFFFVAEYPYYAVNSYFNGLKTYYGLDGLRWMEPMYPDDYKMVLWFRDAVSDQPVILEGVGDSYTDYARVSANTGLPTVLGWPVHEWLWRKTYDEAGKRVAEVQTLYESQDLEETKKLLKKYNVSYVIVGNLEREKYKNIEVKKWERLGKIVFESGTSKVFKLNSL